MDVSVRQHTNYSNPRKESLGRRGGKAMGGWRGKGRKWDFDKARCGRTRHWKFALPHYMKFNFAILRQF